MNKHIAKRNFTTMTQIGALGALAFLTGCDIIDGPSAEQALTG